MKRYFCDRCKEEVKELHKLKVPDKPYGTGYMSKEIEVCKSCQDFIQKAENEYNMAKVKERFVFYKTLLPELIDEV